MKKLYCKVNFENGSTLVRVDSDKNFVEVLPSQEEFMKFFRDQLIKKAQNPKFTPDPYKVIVSDEKFEELTNIIKYKLGRSEKVITKSINLVYNSNTFPVIQIVKN